MRFETYLTNLIGEAEAKSLLDAIHAGKTIVIKGPQGPTGKSTLQNVLRKGGASAFESGDVYEVTVQKPLAERTPNLELTIFF